MSAAVIMTLDQSPNNTGWALGKVWDARPLFGKFAMKPWGNDEPDRCYQFCLWLDEMICKHRVTHLFYEADVPKAGLGIAKMKAGRNGSMRPIIVNQKDPDIQRNQTAVIVVTWLMARARNIPVKPIDVNDMRRRFLGSATVPGLKGDALRKELKARAVRACLLRGWDVEDDNVAEALGHFDYACSVVDPKHAGKHDILERRAELDLWKGERL